jgi:hypothetical protein
MSAVPLTRAARAQWNKGTLVLGHEMAKFILEFMEFVLEFMTYLHPRVSNILFFRKTILPQKWKNGILGKQNRKTLQSFHLPSMNIIQSHVQVALEYSFQHKVTRPNSKILQRGE